MKCSRLRIFSFDHHSLPDRPGCRKMAGFLAHRTWQSVTNVFQCLPHPPLSGRAKNPLFDPKQSHTYGPALEGKARRGRACGARHSGQSELACSHPHPGKSRKYTNTGTTHVKKMCKVHVWKAETSGTKLCCRGILVFRIVTTANTLPRMKSSGQSTQASL